MTEEQTGRQFTKELCVWSKTGEIPKCGNQDVRYFLELQKERLKERGLRMECELEPPKMENDRMTGGMAARGRRESVKYESRIDYWNYTRTLRFFRNGKNLFSKKEQELLYVTTTGLKTGAVDGSETYCCPNCAAIGTVNELQNGCPYCGTKFMMSDLFPKVTDFLFTKDYGERSSELTLKIRMLMTIGAVIGAAIQFLRFFGREWIGTVILTMIVGSLGGAVLAYVIWAVSKLASVFTAAAGSVSPLIEQQDAKKKITVLLAGFDPGFSYEYFVNRLISTLKIFIFEKERKNLAQYAGEAMHQELDQVIESSFNGRIKLNGYQVYNGYCTINLNIGMTNIYDNGKRIYQKKDVFCVTIMKNIMHMEDPGFSIKKVQCHSCGGSFDAVRMRFCPYCNATYDMRDDAWVITEVFK